MRWSLLGLVLLAFCGHGGSEPADTGETETSEWTLQGVNCQTTLISRAVGLSFSGEQQSSKEMSTGQEGGEWRPIKLPTNTLAVCSKFEYNTCCTRSHTLSLLRLIQPYYIAFLEQSPTCAAFSEAVLCIGCHPLIGTNQVHHICASLCDQWFQQCKHEYFSFQGLQSFSHPIPCADDAVLCSQLKAVVSSGKEMCELYGLPVSSIADEEECYDGKIDYSELGYGEDSGRRNLASSTEGSFFLLLQSAFRKLIAVSQIAMEEWSSTAVLIAGKKHAREFLSELSSLEIPTLQQRIEKVKKQLMLGVNWLRENWLAVMTLALFFIPLFFFPYDRY